MEDKIRTITTESGFTCEVDEEFLDDYEIVEAIADLAEIQTDGAAGLAGLKKLLDLMLGKEQKKKLIEHLRSIHGRAKTSEMQKEITQIIAGLGAAKKN